jgi:hypothetical protein
MCGLEHRSNLPEIVAFSTSVDFAVATAVAVSSIELQIVQRLYACATLSPLG